MSRYLRPDRMEDALAALADGPWMPLAGGTDFYPARVGRDITDSLLDLSALPGLRGITDEGGRWRLGAMTTWSDLGRRDLPPGLAALQEAAREIGGVQIQNAGTIGGNLCNASPAADGVPALLALDASVELRSAAGTRELPLAAFITAPRRTERRPQELLTAIHIPKPAGRMRSVFLKLGARRYLVISIVMVAACLEVDEDGRILRAGVAVGACSAVAQRLTGLEQALLGKDQRSASAVVTAGFLRELRPVDDVRGQAVYRMDAAETLVRDALRELAA